MRSIFSAVFRNFDRRAYARDVATAAALGDAGDVVCQCVVEKKLWPWEKVPAFWDGAGMNSGRN